MKVILLARDSHVAMYRQLAQRLREAIACGKYRRGGKRIGKLVKNFGHLALGLGPSPPAPRPNPPTEVTRS